MTASKSKDETPNNTQTETKKIGERKINKSCQENKTF